MPVNQGVKPSAADFVLGTGVNGPGGDVGVGADDGIGGSLGTRCSSDACGRGETTDTEARGAAEQAQSRLAKASPASSNLSDRIAFLPCELVDIVLAQLKCGYELVTSVIGGLQHLGITIRDAQFFEGVGGVFIGQLGEQGRAAS